MILNCGTLWSYSLFGFENSIGRLKKYVIGNTDVLDQISQKYLIDKNGCALRSSLSEQSDNDFTQMYQPKTIQVEQKYANIRLSCFEIISSEKSYIKIWRRIRLKEQMYTSSKAVETKSIDYSVKMTNQEIGKN